MFKPIFIQKLPFLFILSAKLFAFLPMLYRHRGISAYYYIRYNVWIKELQLQLSVYNNDLSSTKTLSLESAPIKIGGVVQDLFYFTIFFPLLNDKHKRSFCYFVGPSFLHPSMPPSFNPLTGDRREKTRKGKGGNVIIRLIS